MRDRIDKGGIRLRVRSYMNTGCLELKVELQRDTMEKRWVVLQL